MYITIGAAVTTEHSVELLFKPSPPPVEPHAPSLGLKPSKVEPQEKADPAFVKDGMLITFMFIELHM